MAKSPDQIVADIDRQQNEEDLDLIPRAGRMLKAKLDEDLTGGAYTGNRLNVGKDRGSRLGRLSKEDSDMLMKQDAESGMNKNPRMGGMSGSSTKTSIAEKYGMKKGGSVKASSASKRADGCALRGKTKGKMVAMCGGGYAKGKK